MSGWVRLPNVPGQLSLVYNLKQEIPNTVIAALFQAFGDIKSIKSLQNQGNPNPMIEGGMKTTVRMIEYYDERHAAAAEKHPRPRARRGRGFRNRSGKMNCL